MLRANAEVAAKGNSHAFSPELMGSHALLLCPIRTTYDPRPLSLRLTCVSLAKQRLMAGGAMLTRLPLS